MRLSTYPLALVTADLCVVGAISLDVNSTASIRNASATIAYDLMAWYQNNQSSTAPAAIGTLPAPLYWWEAGAVWGGMIDYWAYTNDTSYVTTVQQALLAQVGPNKDYMMPAYYASLGNDDQAFWAIAVLSALEYGFPVPNESKSTVWLHLAQAVFNTQASRWDTTSCGGGLKWQIFESNAGYNYKNSISNGALFQISARLAHYTGNHSYVDWASRTWDWMSAIGLIDPIGYNVYDGSDDLLNCTALDHAQWSYNPAMLLYGSAMMYNFTNGSQLWENRTTGLLQVAANNFFSPYDNATNIMYEPQCEPSGTCNNDQFSFKAYLARWMAKSAIVAPYIAGPVTTLLTRSAEAAAQACSGGQSGSTCGQRWYVGGYDGNYGVGQELSALETVHALLLLHGVQGTQRYPLTSQDVHVEVVSPDPTSTFSIPPRTSATGGSAGSSTTGPSSPRPSEGSTVRTTGNCGAVVWMILSLLVAAGIVFGGSFGLLR